MEDLAKAALPLRNRHPQAGAVRRLPDKLMITLEKIDPF
jgi:hypothetical protein